MRLRMLVEKHNISHEALGKRLDLSRSAAGRIVNADAAITLKTLDALCEFFQMTPAEFVVEPGSLIQAITPLEAQLLRAFRSMNDLQRHSLLAVLDRREVEPTKRRRAKLGRAELTEEQQLVVDLYARSEPQAREGVLKVLRGTARKAAQDARADADGTSG